MSTQREKKLAGRIAQLSEVFHAFRMDVANNNIVSVLVVSWALLETADTISAAIYSLGDTIRGK